MSYFITTSFWPNLPPSNPCYPVCITSSFPVLCNAFEIRPSVEQTVSRSHTNELFSAEKDRGRRAGKTAPFSTAGAIATMPGILPMKMIRVGTTTQSRIAQACDRCRSKKIRCDGIRPSCTQCTNVGFECKTSDKLSRRAFPRGYTESLEDRVRGLEAEVRELKQLLDEKDEKLDMLSRIHSFSPVSRHGSASMSPGTQAQVKAEITPAPEEVLHVELPAPVRPNKSSMGTSTTAALIESFETKVQENGRSCPNVVPSTLLSTPAPGVKYPLYTNNTSIAPPRLLSDQYISKFFFGELSNVLTISHRSVLPRMATTPARATQTDLPETLRAVSARP